MNRPFKSLARGMYAMGQAVYCDESCWHIHDGHGCEHEGHACGCPHSACLPSSSGINPSSGRTPRPLVCCTSCPRFVETLPQTKSNSASSGGARGENRRLRRAIESAHQRVCERGSGSWRTA